VEIPALAGRPRFDIADIVRRHRASLEAELSPGQRRVLSAIELCRTAALGGHVDVCRSCGYEHPAYNSCRNRHCPKCQALAQERWIAARSAQLLPVKHFHVVFTLPGVLRPLALFRPTQLFNALFSAAAATLRELAGTRLGGCLGSTMVLHTWTRELCFHPHIHAIVTAGALSFDKERWKPSSHKYLFPKEVMGIHLRGRMIETLRFMHHRGDFTGFDEFRDPEAFEALIARLARTRWVVYAKQPFPRAEHVLSYLGRYTHRVGIANSRLVGVTDESVTFRTKHGNTITLPAIVFLRRFLLHVLPDRFHKIRHYGLYASAAARPDAPGDIARRILGTLETDRPERPSSKTPDWEWEMALLGLDVVHCPQCGKALERVVVPNRLPTVPRGPPAWGAA
jgi:hypothetical protein